MVRLQQLPHLESPSYRVQELRRRGIPDRRLYARDIERPAHGIVLRPNAGLDVRTVEGRCLAFLPGLGGSHFYSKTTAAALWGMPAFANEADEDDRLVVGAFKPHHPPRRPEILGHVVAPHRLNVQRLRGLPVPSAEDTYCLLGTGLTHEQLVAVGDFLISERHTGNGWRAAPLCTLDRIRAAMIRHRGARGARALAYALPHLRNGVDSPAETQLRLIITAAGLPEPRTNCPVPLHDRTLHADLGYEARKIAIEYEGRYHFVGGERQARKDVNRWERMNDAGWRVLRATASDLRDPATFLARLARVLGTPGRSR